MWLLSNKVKVKDSGLLEGFCDCHCHLLPGVDDGVRETAETLDILKLWEEAGVREVWLTPHVMEEMPNSPEELQTHFKTLKEQYRGNITLHLAAENMMDGLLAARIEKGEVLAIGPGQRHLLVETSYYNPPMNMEQVIQHIKEKGYTPILAHPERYRYMDMADYTYWKTKGVLLQLNIPSLVGMYGVEAQHKAEDLLKKGMYDCAGTDTHSLDFAEDFMEGTMKKQIVKEMMKELGGVKEVNGVKEVRRS